MMAPDVIRTRYLGPKNKYKSRISASCQSMRILFPYDHALDLFGNHVAAAKRLAQMSEMLGAYACGVMSDGTYVHVLVGGSTFGVAE